MKAALKSFDWCRFEQHLSAVDLDAVVVSELLGHLRRNADFVIKRPDVAKEMSRATFVEELGRFLQERLGVEAAVSLRAEVELTERIEAGYHEILRTQEATAAAKLLPETQASAALSRATHAYDELTKAVLSSSRRREELILQSFRVRRPDGSSFSPDGVLTAVVDIATRTLMLLGHRQGWFDAGGFLVLPELREVTDEEIYKAGATEFLAASWRHWEHMEQRCRYFDGEIKTFDGANLPKWAPTGAATAIQYDHIGEAEFFDHLANHRLNDRMIQTFQEMMLQTGVQAEESGIAAPLDLPPGAFVSTEEAHADVSLCEILGYPIVDDLERPCGLRLVEWVRGYATLRCVVEERSVRDGRDGLCVTISYDNLAAILDRVGLKNGAAQTFIENVSLRASSRDLFDHPLIKLSNGSLVMFGPGILDTDPARATLSSIGHRGERLSRKGKAFECEMLRFLQEQGLKARPFNFKMGGQKYEFDAIVSWGDYVFVLECKNRTLSGHNPAAAYHFALEMTSAIHQTTRLADALKAHAALVRQRAGVDVAGKTIVPCVVNSLPYAMNGRRGGVYVVDASSLRRFFQERYFHVIRPHILKRKATTVLHRIAVKDIWGDEKPTPEHLMKYLEDLPQLQLTSAHIDVGRHGFSLGERTVVAVSHLAQTEVTIESMAGAFSADGKLVRREAKTFSLAIRSAAKRYDERTVRETDRAWRARPRK